MDIEKLEEAARLGTELRKPGGLTPPMATLGVLALLGNTDPPSAEELARACDLFTGPRPDGAVKSRYSELSGVAEKIFKKFNSKAKLLPGMAESSYRRIILEVSIFSLEGRGHGPQAAGVQSLAALALSGIPAPETAQLYELYSDAVEVVYKNATTSTRWRAKKRGLEGLEDFIGRYRIATRQPLPAPSPTAMGAGARRRSAASAGLTKKRYSQFVASLFSDYVAARSELENDESEPSVRFFFPGGAVLRVGVVRSTIYATIVRVPDGLLYAESRQGGAGDLAEEIKMELARHKIVEIPGL